MASSGDRAVRRDQTSDLQFLIDSTPSLIHTGRPDGYLDFFNQTCLRYVGQSLEDLQGWKWTAFIHPEDVEGIVEKWRASLASGEPFLHEARVQRADGEYRWMLHHRVATRDGCGQIVKRYGSSIDIEDRRRAEEQLRRSTQELQRSEFCLAEGQRLAHMGICGVTAQVMRVAPRNATVLVTGEHMVHGPFLQMARSRRAQSGRIRAGCRDHRIAQEQEAEAEAHRRTRYQSTHSSSRNTSVVTFLEPNKRPFLRVFSIEVSLSTVLITLSSDGAKSALLAGGVLDASSTANITMGLRRLHAEKMYL